MAKPASAQCNLACHYCYYLEKGATAPMSDSLLEEFTKQYIQMQTTGHVLFTWHGGEPMLRPLEFYEKALHFQRRYAEGRHIENCIQTNGTLLTPEWCKFLHKNKWLVGLSIDGTQQQHDAFRQNRYARPTHQRVLDAIEMLNYYKVEWNAMATINSRNVCEPVEFYLFFKQIGCRYIQFTPIVERILFDDSGQRLATVDDDAQHLASFGVGAKEWGDFLCQLFDEWVRTDVGEVFVQLFDATLANWLGFTPGVCSMAEECGHAGVIEANGDLYSCDHFVFPQFRLGNIWQNSLIEMMYGAQQSDFSARKRKNLPRLCKQCRWLFACHGECPKNRFLKTEDGEPGLNFLCRGYKKFFAHVAPYMDRMAELYRQGEDVSKIMSEIS